MWAASLWAALFTGILVAWSPRYWAVAVAITSLAIVVACWTVKRLVLATQPGRDRPAEDSGDISWRTVWPWQILLLTLIGAWGFLQLATNLTVLPQLTLDSSILWAFRAVAFVLAAQILRHSQSRRLFLTLLLWSLTALAAIAMLQFYQTPGRVFGLFPAEDSVFGTYLNRNQFAALMEIAAPVALWYAVDSNIIYGALCYTTILAATITATSRTGVILVLVEVVIFLGLQLRRRGLNKRSITLSFAGLAALIALATAIAGTDRIMSRFNQEHPYAMRRALLRSTLRLIADRPWSGYGLGTWAAVYPRYATFDVALFANEAHNDWAQWTAEGGFPFLLLMLFLTLSIIRPAIRSIWGLGLVFVLIHSWVDFPIREPSLSFLWFALAGAVSRSNPGPAEAIERNRRLKMYGAAQGKLETTGAV